MRVNVSLALFPLVTTAHELAKESRSVSLCLIIGNNNVLYHIFTTANTSQKQSRVIISGNGFWKLLNRVNTV